jgi:hypothetical protein
MHRKSRKLGVSSKKLIQVAVESHCIKKVDEARKDLSDNKVDLFSLLADLQLRKQ